MQDGTRFSEAAVLLARWRSRAANGDHQAEQEVWNLEVKPGKDGKLILTIGPD